MEAVSLSEIVRAPTRLWKSTDTEKMHSCCKVNFIATVAYGDPREQVKFLPDFVHGMRFAIGLIGKVRNVLRHLKWRLRP